MRPEVITPIIKISEICNFDCMFCYYSEEKSNAINLMNIELCKKIIKDSFFFNYKNNIYRLKIIFHGGEPLLRGISFLKEIISYEQYLINNCDKKFVIQNSIQTNGFLIDEEWCNLFKEHDFEVGVSIDGDEDLNYHYKDGTDKRVITRNVLKNINLLQSTGVRFGILSVITNKHSEYVREFYKFIVENEIHSLGLCPCFNPENNFTVESDALTKFYTQFFDMYFYNQYKLNIREFDSILKKLLNVKKGYPCNYSQRKFCGSFLTFDCTGNVFFCDKAYEKERAIGNIFNQTIDEIYLSNLFFKESQKCSEFYSKQCTNCEIKDICGGGCYRNDVEMSVNTTTNCFCESMKKLVFHIKNILQNNINI